MCDPLEVGADLLPLEVLCLVIVVEARGVYFRTMTQYLLVDVLGAVVETGVRDAQLVAHLVRVYHVRILLAAASVTVRPETAASESASVVGVCVRRQLALSRRQYRHGPGELVAGLAEVQVGERH